MLFSPNSDLLPAGSEGLLGQFVDLKVSSRKGAPPYVFKSRAKRFTPVATVENSAQVEMSFRRIAMEVKPDGCFSLLERKRV